MKNVFLYVALVSCMTANVAYSAAPTQTRRGGGANAGGTASAAPVVSARAATNVRGAKPNTTGSAVSARSATVSARAAKPAAGASTAKNGGTPVLSARAGATQKVISTGTKVSAAAQNVVVSEECKSKYNGCMDSFCMIDNTTGGRCVCSDKNAEFDAILAEIERLDQQSYQMATTGLEKMQMGDDAEAAIAKANAVAKEFETQSKTQAATKKKQRATLDLSMWNTNFDDTFDFDEEIQSTQSVITSLEGKEGDALYNAVNSICVAQMPECSKETSLLQLMYQTQIKADCSAYSNTLSQRKTASAQKLQAAQKALREEALDQIQTANKYDLGQCVIEFSKCMQTTAGCGNDYSECASAGGEAMTVDQSVRLSSNADKDYTIKNTNVKIKQITFDIISSKKVMCESVTKQCTRVAGQVWDTFLQNVAPQLKSAELIAEEKTRMNSIKTVADCFAKACKDNFDPNIPDGSYDLCLSNPKNMASVCKNALAKAGINASDVTNDTGKNTLWNSIKMRLASMRVDSCTNTIKSCIQDRCGEDYAGCIGFATDSIFEICPEDKLKVSCAKDGDTTDIYEKVTEVAKGLLLNIDNSIVTACNSALEEQKASICGDSGDDWCGGISISYTLGKNDLGYEIDCSGKQYENVTSVLAAFSNYTKEDKENKLRKCSVRYKNTIDDWSNISYDETNGIIDGCGDGGKICDEMNTVFKQKMSIFTENPTLNACINGRSVDGVTNSRNNSTDENGNLTRTSNTTNGVISSGRDMLASVKSVIAWGIISKTRENYTTRYDELAAAMDIQRTQLATLLGAPTEAKCAIDISDPTMIKCETTDGTVVNTKDWRTTIAQCLVRGIPDSKDLDKLYRGYTNTTGTTEDGIAYYANVNDIPTYFEQTYHISSTRSGSEDRIVKNQWDAVAKKCTATTIKKYCSKGGGLFNRDKHRTKCKKWSEEEPVTTVTYANDDAE